MKKTLLIILVAVTGAIAFNANAQVLQSTSESSSSSKSVEKEHVKKTISTTETFIAKGTNLITAHIDPFRDGYIPFVSASYEHVVYDLDPALSASVGGQLGYGGFVKGSSFFGVHARAALHFHPITTRWDFYGGVQLGKTIINDEYVSSLGGMLNSISYYYFGGQYFFNDNFAVNARFAGWGIINLGVTYKF